MSEILHKKSPYRTIIPYRLYYHTRIYPLYLCRGSATREDLSSCRFVDCGGAMLADCCGAVGMISSPFCSSLFGANSAVILRSRAASSDLSCFNSSSLPHVLATIASSWGTSALSLAVQGRRISLIWNNTYLILSIISLLLMKKFSRMLLITSRT